jgi:hypothetical protein
MLVPSQNYRYLLCWNSLTFLRELKGTVQRDLSIVGHATLKMLRRKSKMQFLKQERNTQNAIELFIVHCTAKINAKNEGSHKKIIKRKERNRSSIK